MIDFNKDYFPDRSQWTSQASVEASSSNTLPKPLPGFIKRKLDLIDRLSNVSSYFGYMTGAAVFLNGLCRNIGEYTESVNTNSDLMRDMVAIHGMPILYGLGTGLLGFTVGCLSHISLVNRVIKRYPAYKQQINKYCYPSV